MHSTETVAYPNDHMLDDVIEAIVKLIEQFLLRRLLITWCEH